MSSARAGFETTRAARPLLVRKPQDREDYREREDQHPHEDMVILHGDVFLIRTSFFDIWLRTVDGVIAVQHAAVRAPHRIGVSTKHHVRRDDTRGHQDQKREELDHAAA